MNRDLRNEMTEKSREVCSPSGNRSGVANHPDVWSQALKPLRLTQTYEFYAPILARVNPPVCISLTDR